MRTFTFPQYLALYTQSLNPLETESHAYKHLISCETPLSQLKI